MIFIQVLMITASINNVHKMTTNRGYLFLNSRKPTGACLRGLINLAKLPKRSSNFMIKRWCHLLVGVHGVLAASTRSSRLPGGASSIVALPENFFTHSRLNATDKKADNICYRFISIISDLRFESKSTDFKFGNNTELFCITNQYLLVGARFLNHYIFIF